MNTEVILAVLLVWSVAGFMAALAFGKAIRAIELTDEQLLRGTGGNVTYLRKKHRHPANQRSHTARTRDGSAKRVTG
ncbi:MAG: hypothetical protein WD823_05285 [Sulfuricaulis sp.]|uniref:hypothetical protein n=1 Tax=Sulfuricaulis sp. TaxID=2003553 RepID=UPI0034A4A5FF